MLPMAVTSPQGKKGELNMKLEQLKTRIADSGMTLTAVARLTGMSRMTLYNKLDGKHEFKVSEIISLCEALHLSDKERNAIFFS